jgi:hypothetical protein
MKNIVSKIKSIFSIKGMKERSLSSVGMVALFFAVLYL